MTSLPNLEHSLLHEYTRLHARGEYGNTGNRAIPGILPHIRALSPTSIIDFGCGQSDVAEILARKVESVHNTYRYDPAIASLSQLPAATFDLLVNIDVLEHIEDEHLDGAIDKMHSLARHAIIVIDTAPAVTLLSDGRNAHVSQHDQAWWHDRLRRHYPEIRPFGARLKNRAAFKTFSESPSWLSSISTFYFENTSRLIKKYVCSRLWQKHTSIRAV